MKTFSRSIFVTLLLCFPEVICKTKIVIDTDGIADDVRGMSLALQNPDVEVLAITAVNGCTRASNAAANIARTLRANKKKNVPFYRGASNPLIGSYETSDFEKMFFGVDGLGDFPNEYPPVLPSDRESHSHDMHAATALIHIFKKNRDAKLVCIGPLTNVALALKLDPRFAEYPKEIFIMGGNIFGKGNVASNSTAEFNFEADPEAAHIVLKEMKVPITIMPWESFLSQSKGSKVDFHAHMKLNIPLAKYFEMATRKGRAIYDKNNEQWSYCDEVAVVASFAPQIITDYKVLRGAVELHGSYTRGQIALDWTEEFNPQDNMSKKGIKFITGYNVKALDDMVFEAIRRSQYN